MYFVNGKNAHIKRFTVRYAICGGFWKSTVTTTTNKCTNRNIQSNISCSTVSSLFHVSFAVKISFSLRLYVCVCVFGYARESVTEQMKIGCVQWEFFLYYLWTLRIFIYGLHCCLWEMDQAYAICELWQFSIYCTYTLENTSCHLLRFPKLWTKLFHSYRIMHGHLKNSEAFTTFFYFQMK